MKIYIQLFRLYTYLEDVFWYVCVLTAREMVLRLCRWSSASWGLARYWGSSACSSRMENGTIEPGHKGKARWRGEDDREWRKKMWEVEGTIWNMVGWECSSKVRKKKKAERQKDENIKLSTHTQTVHSPGGRNLQMAPSYVWLLIKPSHLSISVCCAAPSLISLPHPSASLYIIHTLPHTLLCACMQAHTRMHTPESMFRWVPWLWSGSLWYRHLIWNQLATPSLAPASASLCISVSIYILFTFVFYQTHLEDTINSLFLILPSGCIAVQWTYLYGQQSVLLWCDWLVSDNGPLVLWIWLNVYYNSLLSNTFVRFVFKANTHKKEN